MAGNLVPPNAPDATKRNHARFRARTFVKTPWGKVLALTTALLIASLIAPLYVTGWNRSIFQPLANDELRAKMQLWLTVIIAQAVLWILAVFYLGQSLKRLRDSGPWTKQVAKALIPFTPALILLGVLLLKQVPAISDVHIAPLKPFALPSEDLRVPPKCIGATYDVIKHQCGENAYDISRLPEFGTIGILIAGLAMWQMYFILANIQSAFFIGSGKPTGIEMSQYIKLRQEVLRLLAIAGAVLALGTLSGAALRNAVNTGAKTNYFPKEYVIVYGAANTILLFVAYIPVQFVFFRIGANLRDRLSDDNFSGVAGLKMWNDTNNSLEEILGLKLTASALLGPALSTLLPVVTGWLANFLGKN